MKVLDVRFCYHRNISENNNFLNLVADDRRVTNIWRQRWQSLAGKLKSLKFSWIAKLLDTENSHPWKAIANMLLTPVEGSNIFHSNSHFFMESARNLKKELRIFYQDLINIFMEMPKPVELTPIFLENQSNCTSRMRSQSQLRNDKYIMMQYTNWINSAPSQQ